MTVLDIRPFPPATEDASSTPGPTPAPAGHERRRHVRTAATRPAKLFLPGSLRYAASETTDISDGGALLRVDRARSVAKGDRIDVAVIAPGQPAAVLESKAMLAARVVRVTPIDHYHQAVAVAFEAQDAGGDELRPSLAA